MITVKTRADAVEAGLGSRLKMIDARVNLFLNFAHFLAAQLI